MTHSPTFSRWHTGDLRNNNAYAYIRYYIAFEHTPFFGFSGAFHWRLRVTYTILSYAAVVSMYKSNDISTFILKMIDFPLGKRHFNVLFIYTMAAHVPRHRLRHVFLFCVYSHFSEIATFFCPRWTYEKGCWVIPNLKYLKKNQKKFKKNLKKF